MRLILVVSIAIFVAGYGSHNQQVRHPEPKAKGQSKGEGTITVITINSYAGIDNGGGSFGITGSDIKDVGLEDLVKALVKHNRDNPGAEYEIYAKYKTGSEVCDIVIDAIRKTGVNLRHYWAPFCAVDTERKPGKYGVGYLDILSPDEEKGSGTFVRSKAKGQSKGESTIIVITISYPGTGNGGGLFGITGSDIKDVGLEDLVEALVKHNRNHPGAEYEIYTEYKCPSESSDMIVDAIRKTGVKLRHHWAPVSFVDTERKPGKYGVGYLDILSPVEEKVSVTFVRSKAKGQSKGESTITVITINSYPGIGDDDGSFGITGSDIKDVGLEDLVKALVKRNRDNPGEEYEVYAKYKCPPEPVDRVVDAIRKTGVNLRHYWVPVSDGYIDRKPGKYGRGHIDILSP